MMTTRFKVPTEFGTEETYCEKFSEKILLEEFGKSPPRYRRFIIGGLLGKSKKNR